jgi:hypothetical protein
MGHNNCRVLFILKYRELYDLDSGYECSNKKLCSGLANSARFVHDMLAKHHIDTKMVEVIDNNEIDREVSIYNPTHVIIEAFWVVPEKFEVLQMLHPNVIWVVRSHSEIPFLAQEGSAMDWLIRYVQHRNVYVAANSEKAVRDFRTIISAANPFWDEAKVENKVPFLSNFYPIHHKPRNARKQDDILEVGCFGAVRPLKNQLIQAVAAIEFATITGKYLRFHINADRAEQGGSSILINLRSLFSGIANGELVEHPWMDHSKFLSLLSEMDISLVVSLTESFCIVAADSVAARVPVVGSSEIKFLSSLAKANPTDSEDIVLKMLQVSGWRYKFTLKIINLLNLKRYSNASKKTWLDYLSE